MVTVVLQLTAMAGDKQPNPMLSKEPLTQEQIAVYRAVLADYMKGSEGTLNLAKKTVPLERSGSFWPEECVKPMELEPVPKSGPVVHAFDPAIDLGVKIVVVDPEAQAKTVEANDPGNVIRSGAQSGPPPSEDQIGAAVKKAFETAQFTLSEIIFDKEHKHAIVSYGFHCGALCGHGATVIVAKEGASWKIKKRCSSWIS
jgi:hypothetical protein